MIKLLLVEDEETIRAGIRSVITGLADGFEIAEEAGNGKEALGYLQSNVPDAILTDIRMREMDGLTLIAKVRERYPDMPLVIISGYGDFEYAQQALRYGVTDYLLKPIDRASMLKALERIRSLVDKGRGKSHRTESEEKELPPGDGRKLIRKLKAHIDGHPDGDLRLQTLAELVHLSPVYLSKLFKQETSDNLSDYIMAARLARAKHLLASTELKIYDVARLSGYQSPKHFMLVFKKATGVSPGSYREEHGV
ncbi:response regulator [Cohnella thailandensis]|jgi:Response regulator containing CheY-like receiver domain and AraC-type DNA-binding domain|uniref:Response regulator n=1 Tax=Cohnella thailandensis TaxID=557557 RepID=A0A841T1G8_9BACL|nr:response regulator [Cohnella thailandensis]MBB6637392.1 response regulator [Cohnella thailandensis]MBP1976721.1 YesN/AraC family two-component response regulator [Cohnella thailandensis]